MTLNSRSKRTLLAVVKIALAVTILVVLFLRIQGQAGFERLLNEPKQWRFLLLGQGLVLLAFSLSFVRWFLLVRGLDLEFHLRDAFRLGSLGFLLNQISPGSVGGDLLKAVFIAREQPGKRTEAIATVFLDRVVGLFAMLLIASLGIAFAGNAIESVKLLNSLRTVVWTATLVASLGLLFVLSPWSTGVQVRSLAEKLPVVGSIASRLIESMDVYRSRRGYLSAAFGLALMTHCLLISTFWCVSQGLPVSGPTFFENAAIVPMGLVAGALPLTPGGLGAMEGGMEILFTTIGAEQGEGTLVAFTYRAMTYVVAAMGAFYYFSSRKKVDDLLHDAEELAEETA